MKDRQNCAKVQKSAISRILWITKEIQSNLAYCDAFHCLCASAEYNMGPAARELLWKAEVQNSGKVSKLVGCLKENFGFLQSNKRFVQATEKTP